MRLRATSGLPATSAGQLQSSETPTSESSRPRSAIMSVALGRRETILISAMVAWARFGHRDPGAAALEAAERDRRRGDAQRHRQDDDHAGTDRGAAASRPRRAAV